jgi:phosphomannomutase
MRSGNHVDRRPGLVNFSIIGRNCSNKDRELYVEYDKASNERERIMLALKRKHKDYDIQVAGETGIDIMEKGKDKSQIVEEFSLNDELHFFGDRMDINGNDYTLARRVIERGGVCYHVKDWSETWEHLKKLSA